MSAVYSDAAWVVQKIVERKAGLKTIVFDLLPEHRQQRAQPPLTSVYAVACESLKYRSHLLEMLSDVGISEDDEDIHMYVVMAYDLLIGQKRKISGGGACKAKIMGVGEKLRELMAKKMEGKESIKELLPQALQNPEGAHLPKYVRVNTLRTDMEKVIEAYQEDGFTLSDATEPGAKNFHKDPHVGNLLVFAPGTDLHKCRLVESGEVVLQDKASCFPAQAMAEAEGIQTWQFIDACAAPGNKTTHLAMLAGKGCKIDAFERDLRRSKLLKARVKQIGASKQIQVHNKDFLQTDVMGQSFNQVRGIIVDPSCSGSGLVGHRTDHAINQQDQEKELAKVRKIAGFQKRIVQHALSFPLVERVVYSTCSVHVQENEDVVAAVLPLAREKGLDLVKCLSSWPERGIPTDGLSADLAKRCVRCNVGETATTHGFFVAVFARTKPSKVSVPKPVVAEKRRAEPQKQGWVLAKPAKKKKKN